MSKVSAAGSRGEAEVVRGNISQQLGSLLPFFALILLIGWCAVRFADYGSFGFVLDAQDVMAEEKMQGNLVWSTESGLLRKIVNGTNVQKLYWLLLGDDISNFLAISKILYINSVGTTSRVGHVLTMVILLNIINTASDVDAILGIKSSVVTSWGSLIQIGSNVRWVAIIPLLSAFLELVSINHCRDKAGLKDDLSAASGNLSFRGVFYVSSRFLASMVCTTIFVASLYSSTNLVALMGSLAFFMAVWPFLDKILNKSSCLTRPHTVMAHEGRVITLTSLACFLCVFLVRLCNRFELLHPRLETVLSASIEHFFVREIIHICIDSTRLFDQIDGTGKVGFTDDIADLKYGRGHVIGQWRQDLSRINAFMRYITHEMGSPMSSLALTLETLNDGVLRRSGSESDLSMLCGSGIFSSSSSGGSTSSGSTSSMIRSRSNASIDLMNVDLCTGTPGARCGSASPRLGLTPTSSYADLTKSGATADVLEAISVGRGSLQYMSKVMRDMRTFQETLDPFRKGLHRGARRPGARGGGASRLRESQEEARRNPHTRSHKSNNSEIDLPSVFDVDAVIVEVLRSSSVLDVIRAHGVPKVVINHDGTGRVKSSLYSFKSAVEALLLGALGASVVDSPLVIDVTLRKSLGSKSIPAHFGEVSETHPFRTTLESSHSDAAEAEIILRVTFQGDLMSPESIASLMESMPWYATCVPGGQHVQDAGDWHAERIGDLSATISRIKSLIQPLRGRLEFQSHAQPPQKKSTWANFRTAGTKFRCARDPAVQAPVAAPVTFSTHDANAVPLGHFTEPLPSDTVQNSADSRGDGPSMYTCGENAENAGFDAASQYTSKGGSSLDTHVALKLATAINKFSMTVNVLHLTRTGSLSRRRQHVLRFMDPQSFSSGGHLDNSDKETVEIFDFNRKAPSSSTSLSHLARESAAHKESSGHSRSSTPLGDPTKGASQCDASDCTSGDGDSMSSNM